MHFGYWSEGYWTWDDDFLNRAYYVDLKGNIDKYDKRMTFGVFYVNDGIDHKEEVERKLN